MDRAEGAGGDARSGARDEWTALRHGGFVAERANRFMGAVVGALIGDVLGRRVLSSRWSEIKEVFGERGVVALGEAGPGERMSDGAVLMVLAIDGLIRADRARLAAKGVDPVAELRRVYDLWAVEPSEISGSSAGGWLAEHLPHHLAGSRNVALLRGKMSDAGPGEYPEDSVSALYSAIPMGIWASFSESVFGFVGRAMQITGESGEATAAAKAVAVMVQQNILTGNFVRAFDQVLEVDPDRLGAERTLLLDSLNAGLSLARRDITPEEIETLGTGDTPASALAIAVCAVQSAQTSFDEALRIAVNHSGNSAITGALAGAIMGSSFSGVADISGDWARGLAGGKLLFRLAQDACEQFAPEPRDDAEWQRRYPTLSVGDSGNTDPGILADQPHLAADRGAALTGKVAASLTLDEQVVLETRGRSDTTTDYEWRNGERVMGYWDAQRVRRVFGRSSDEFCQELRYDKTIKDASVFYGIGMHFPFAALESVLADVVVHGRLSSSTQMTLFCLDAVVRTETWLRQTKRLIPRTISLLGLLRWLHTQGVPWNRAVTAGVFEEVPEPTGWLIKVPELFERRDPDPVCVEALSAFAERDVTGWFSKPINGARTPSALPRAIALSAWSDIPERVFEQAVANALLTHGHPDAYLSAGAYAVLVNTLLSGGTLEDGIEVVADELAKWPDENVRRLLDSCTLTGPPPSPSELSALVEDGAAPNALAVAVVAAARDNDFESAVRCAAEVLPAAAPLVGGFHGARNGEQGLPREWLERLELRDVVDRLVFDVAAVQVGLPERVWTPDWAAPYPGF
ncbi:ADP-ribosylglycohydrolase family protein [Saccharopolyspora shandongensis]|uniref:ADP-ribosylglycohydrolase family protein n=1 Tax=Saccharopolyspora shandongensis TaxID=418495 RepID=UPI0034313805